MKNIEKRLLGTTEKLFYLLDQITVQHFALAVVIDGQFSLPEWQRAVIAVQQRHPHLNCRIAGNDYAHAFFEPVTNCPIPVTMQQLNPDQEWLPILNEEMTKPFHLDQAPLVRVVLVEQEQQTILIWVSNHAIGDGVSALLAIRDILQVLSGKTITNLSRPASLDELAGIPLNHVSTTLDDAPADPAGLPSEEVKVEILTLSAELTQQIISKAKAKTTTVHNVLSAALVFAGRELTLFEQPGAGRILHPVSARKALHLGEDYHLVFASVITSTEAGETDFWDIAQKIGSDMVVTQTEAFFTDEIKATRELFYSGLAPSAIVDILTQYSQHHLLFSNLTRLPFDVAFGPFKIKSVFGPFVLSALPHAQTVGAITVNGQLNLTLTGRQLTPELLERTRAILEEISAT
jgi:hypothetical protein